MALASCTLCRRCHPELHSSERRAIDEPAHEELSCRNIRSFGSRALDLSAGRCTLCNLEQEDFTPYEQAVERIAATRPMSDIVAEAFGQHPINLEIGGMLVFACAVQELKGNHAFNHSVQGHLMAPQTATAELHAASSEHFLAAMPLPRLLLAAQWSRHALCTNTRGRAPMQASFGNADVLTTGYPSMVEDTVLQAVPWLSWSTADDSVALNTHVAESVSVTCLTQRRWQSSWGEGPQVGRILLGGHGATPSMTWDMHMRVDEDYDLEDA